MYVIIQKSKENNSIVDKDKMISSREKEISEQCSNAIDVSQIDNIKYFSVNKEEFLEIWKLIKPKLDLDLEIQIKNKKKEIDCANWIKINQVCKTRFKIMQMISTWLNDNKSIDFQIIKIFII